MAKSDNEKELVSCLRDTKVRIRFIKKPTGFVSNPKNPMYGGLSIRAKIVLTAPRLRNGSFKNILTDAEKDFLESYLGLEKDAMSVHKKVDNYWENYSLVLSKEDTILNLADPIDYISYKVALANSDLVAPSLEDLQSKRIGTWRFVIINENDELKYKTEKLSATKEAYKLLGALEGNKTKLRTVVQLLKGTPITGNTSVEQLSSWAQEELDKDPKMFLTVVKDEFLDTKVILFEGIEMGVIKKKGDYYYLSDNTPLCGANDEPTLAVVVRYLNAPKNQAMFLKIQNQIKSAKE